MTQAERDAAMIQLIAKLTERVRKLELQLRKDRLERDMDSAALMNPAAMEAISEAVAIGAGLSLADLRGPNRSQRYARARHIAWERCHKAGYSLPIIGRYFGDRDHTTVLSGIRQHRALMAKQSLAICGKLA